MLVHRGRRARPCRSSPARRPDRGVPGCRLRPTSRWCLGPAHRGHPSAGRCTRPQRSIRDRCFDRTLLRPRPPPASRPDRLRWPTEFGWLLRKLAMLGLPRHRPASARPRFVRRHPDVTPRRPALRQRPCADSHVIRCRRPGIPLRRLEPQHRSRTGHCPGAQPRDSAPGQRLLAHPFSVDEQADPDIGPRYHHPVHRESGVPAVQHLRTIRTPQHCCHVTVQEQRHPRRAWRDHPELHLVLVVQAHQPAGGKPCKHAPTARLLGSGRLPHQSEQRRQGLTRRRFRRRRDIRTVRDDQHDAIAVRDQMRTARQYLELCIDAHRNRPPRKRQRWNTTRIGPFTRSQNTSQVRMNWMRNAASDGCSARGKMIVV